jgi:hypothetical protein
LVAVDLAQFANSSVRPSETPRQPLTPLFLCATGAAVVLGIAALSGLDGESLLVAPISLALLGVVLAVRRWDERRQLRKAADAWIERGYESRASRYGWRIHELTSVRERRLLGCTVREIVPELSQRHRYTASPLNRAALRPHRAALIALADRLDDLTRPVSAAGILAVHHLLTQPDSVLYASYFDERPRNAGAELGAILDRLEVRH